MASSVEHLVLTFLLVFVISSFHVHARENRAFSKVTRNEVPSETVAVPEETPAVQVEKAAKFSKDFPTTATYNNNGDDHFNAESFSSSFPDTEYYGQSYRKEGSYNTNGGGYRNRESHSTYRPNYAYRNGQYGMSDTRTLENGRFFYDVKADKGYGAYVGIGVRGATTHTNEYNRATEDNQNNQEDEEYVP